MTKKTEVKSLPLLVSFFCFDNTPTGLHSVYFKVRVRNVDVSKTYTRKEG